MSLKKDIKQEQLQEIKDNIMRRKAQLYEVEQTLPKPNGVYLKIILGNVNVSILNKEERYVYIIILLFCKWHFLYHIMEM